MNNLMGSTGISGMNTGISGLTSPTNPNLPPGLTSPPPSMVLMGQYLPPG